MIPIGIIAGIGNFYIRINIKRSSDILNNLKYLFLLITLERD